MGLDECPLCYYGYHRLSQHLRLFHKVTNKEERQLLLALSSGRVNVRKGACPVPACGKMCSRLDRHLKSHTEMTKEAQREAMKAAKRMKILLDLAKLRATKLVVPMVSSLDLEEVHDAWDTTVTQEEAEQEACSNLCCQESSKALSEQIADLNKQVDTLNTALRNMTRRYHLLRRRSQATPSTRVACVTSTLFSKPGSTEENKLTAEAEHPTTSRPVRARKATKRAASSPLSSSPSTSNSQQAREGPGTMESNLEGPTETKRKRLNFRQRTRMDTSGRGLLLPVVCLSR
ncbi:hypothetical protein QQF64_018541 [Cirrhinus molitorella]|uniref:C2H2-type domain-containing protein n=1 Tax=Cirrhinus molitorella TaxID=172907 RepID=A0ABR3LCW5_9TELE